LWPFRPSFCDSSRVFNTFYGRIVLVPLELEFNDQTQTTHIVKLSQV
jgi:hypothetical protein